MVLFDYCFTCLIYRLCKEYKNSAPHHSNYIASIEEFIKRESLFRGIGCFPKRKYTKDLIPALHTINLLKIKKIV